MADAAQPRMDPPAPPRRYHDLTFGEDFLWVRRDGGEPIAFTRLERALLQALAARPGRLFSRQQLLNAMAGEGQALNDRNVDFLVNRLRKKLQDPARRPRFIGTQYGEGYVWIAAAPRAAGDGFLVVGPLRGLDQADHRPMVEARLRRLHREIASQCAVGHEIVFLPDWSPATSGPPEFRYSVSADFIAGDQGPQAAFSLRDERRGRLLRVVRCDMAGELGDEAQAELAAKLVGAIWRDMVLPPGDPGPTDPPLEVLMQDAALTLSRSRDQGWAYIGRWLEYGRDAHDAELDLMWATYLSVRMHFLDFDAGDAKARVRLEREAEACVLQALPQVRSHPILKLAAAKLLFDLLGDHLDVAEALLAESLAEGATFAAGLSLRGALQAYRGDLAAALASFDQALALMPASREFQVYLRIKKSVVLIAAGDRRAADAELARIAQIKPAARAEVQLFYLHPDEAPSPEAAKALERLSAATARRIVTHQFYRFARYFTNPAHARAIMAGTLRHFLPRFGADIVPAEARSLLGVG